MRKLMNSFRLNEKGFTLIELLVVVAILGVIAGVVVPNIGKFTHEGEDEALKAEFNNVQTAIYLGMIDNEITVISHH